MIRPTISSDLSVGEAVYAGRDLEALSDLPNYYNWIVGRFAPFLTGNGIEFGAGIGTVSARILPSLGHLELVEPSANLASILRQRFAAVERTEVTEMSLEDRLTTAATGTFDTIVMVNVLEHIEDDTAALAGLHRILRPGGHLLLFVPALPFLFSAFDHAVGHFRRYRQGGLLSRIENAGFGVVDVRYMDILGVLPWWLIQTIGGKTEINPRMAMLYDRFGVPVTRAMEYFFAPPFGKNLIAIARAK